MQLDVKIKGLSMDVFREAFAQANSSVDHILDRMLSVVPEVAPKLSQYAPPVSYTHLTLPTIYSV